MAEIIDIELRFMGVDAIDGEDKSEVLDFMFQVASVCLSENPDERPTMAECYHLIQGGSIMDKYKDREADVRERVMSSGFLSHALGLYDSPKGSSRETFAKDDISVVGLRMQGAR